MDENSLMLAYAAPILAAVVESEGCSNLDFCVETTVTLLTKLKAKLQ